MPQPNRFVTARISLRKGTTDQWAENDPVLFIGEPAWDLDKNQIKIGDGERKWSELPYIENLGGSDPWINDGEQFPEFIQESADAINYLKFHHDLLEDNANAYFEAGINQEEFVPLFEVSVKANTGGAASIVGQPRRYAAYKSGEAINIKAVSFNPWVFDGWDGLIGNEADNAETVITATEARNLIAKFRNDG